MKDLIDINLNILQLFDIMPVKKDNGEYETKKTKKPIKNKEIKFILGDKWHFIEMPKNKEIYISVTDLEILRFEKILFSIMESCYYVGFSEGLKNGKEIEACVE